MSQRAPLCPSCNDMHPKAKANPATLTANIVGSHNTVLTRAQKKWSGRRRRKQRVVSPLLIRIISPSERVQCFISSLLGCDTVCQVCPATCLHGRVRLPPNAFSQSVLPNVFTRNCQHNFG